MFSHPPQRTSRRPDGPRSHCVLRRAPADLADVVEVHLDVLAAERASLRLAHLVEQPQPVAEYLDTVLLRAEEGAPPGGAAGGRRGIIERGGQMGESIGVGIPRGRVGCV